MGVLEDEIRKNAEGPQKATGDIGSMTQHSLRDQIAADQYLSGKEVAKAGGIGVRLAKLKPPAAV